jgi:predicted ester cyclase
MVIFRIAAGRIVEAWEVYDEAGMRRQLGISL